MLFSLVIYGCESWRDKERKRDGGVLNYGLEVEPLLILWEIKSASLSQGSTNKNWHALCMWCKSMTGNLMQKPESHYITYVYDPLISAALFYFSL